MPEPPGWAGIKSGGRTPPLPHWQKYNTRHNQNKQYSSCHGQPPPPPPPRPTKLAIAHARLKQSPARVVEGGRGYYRHKKNDRLEADRLVCRVPCVDVQQATSPHCFLFSWHSNMNESLIKLQLPPLPPSEEIPHQGVKWAYCVNIYWGYIRRQS